MKSTSPSTILAVDDDRVTLVMLEAQLHQYGHHVLTATHGEEAITLAKLHAGNLDVIVLDRMLPDIDGLSVVRQLKQDSVLRFIPVVMQTGSDSPQQIREGIDAGVFYYLTKPVVESVLQSVVAAALRERSQNRLLMQQQSREQQGLQLIDTARFRFRTLEEAEALAMFLSHSFPDPQRSVVGLAELLINAVEHGNLGISYEEKTALLAENNWRSEVHRRGELAPFNTRHVEVVLQNKSDGVYVQITDEGEGFDWKSYMLIDPSRTTDSHGRGIAQANAQSFDALRYNTRGNQVLAVAYRHAEETLRLEW